jgi:lactoylglutathione lyase
VPLTLLVIRQEVHVITGIGHAAVTARDIDKSLDFYTRILGLPEAFRMHNDDGGLWMVYVLTGGGGFIEIFANGEDGPDVPQNASGFKHLCPWVDDIEATLKDLQSKGLEVDPTRIRTGRSKCRQYFIADPDGMRIELMQLMPDSYLAAALNT